MCYGPQMRISHCFIQELHSLQRLLSCIRPMIHHSIYEQLITSMFQVRIVESDDPVTKVDLFIKNKLVTLFVCPNNWCTIPLSLVKAY